VSSVTPRNVTAETLSAPDVIANPYPYYAALRDQSPLFGYRDLPPGTVPGEDAPPASWAVLAHDQVAHVARHPEIFSSRDPLQEASGAPTLMLVNHDDPHHRNLRNLVQGAFTASRVASHREWIADRVRRLLEPCADQEVDVMQGLAADLPAMVMTRMLDMPEADYPGFRRWATAFMLSTPMSPEQRQVSNNEMFAYFTAKVDERIAAGASGNSFIDALLQAEFEGGKLSREEVIRFCFTLVVAGSETTTGLLGNLVWLMANYPEEYRTIRQQPEKIEGFIEEALRFAGPPQRLFRIATRDTELGGKSIRKGDWVAIFFASSNHDPAIWDDPDQFRPSREGARAHASFGQGIHSCLGAMLVRLEARCTVEAICELFSNVRPGSAPFVRQTATQLSYALDACPVVFET
jgi:cytochrome P450